ncbi:hypothetical protein B0H14DRAFT_3886010 [Mycena olivaceomarginata]|nr:hypothetical protein B0H14DRAFT_3886010 [Mycena olivaceomarginata]
MAQENTNTSALGRENRGSNGQRKAAASNGGKGTKAKPKKRTQDEMEAELARMKAELAAANEKIARERSSREDTEPVERLERPKGEAGDGKRGFVLQSAMGLDDDRDCSRQLCVHTNVVRANVDFTIDFRRQDPAKLAAVYKLTRDSHKPFLSRERFPLDWAIAEITKQFLRNKRKHAVRRGYIGNREERKRASEGRAIPSSKRRKIRHIDHPEEEEEEDEQQHQQDDGDEEEGNGSE